MPQEFRRKELESSQSGSALPRQLVTEIYDFLYDQSVKQSDPSKCQFQLRHSTDIIDCHPDTDGKVRLSCQHGANATPASQTDAYDLVISATGYDTSEHQRILSPLRHLIDGHKLTVAADYQVNFRSGMKRGLLVFGCCILLWTQMM